MSDANKPPKWAAEMADDLRGLAEQMEAMGERMRMHNTLIPALEHHGLQMIGASSIANQWAAEIEKEAGHE